jgi:hypothetical protein
LLAEGFAANLSTLKDLQRRCRLSNTEAATLCGVSLRTYRRWTSNGNPHPGAVSLLALLGGFVPFKGWEGWEFDNGCLFPPGYSKNGLTPGDFFALVFQRQLISAYRSENATCAHRCGISKRGSPGAGMSAERPFCDRLTVSAPRTHDAALKDVGESYGSALGGMLMRPGMWTLPMGGSFEASGAALRALREAHIFGDYLMALGELPIRVTRLDATLDLPQRAAPEIHRLYDKAVKGRVRLSRKAVDKSAVVQMFSRPRYDGEPLDTGTVYIPSRRLSRADQYVTVYDKRQERLSRGCDDPGPLTRYEATAGRGLGATLGDAYDPTAIFWHIMAPDILQAPPGVPQWTPGGETWRVVPKTPPTPAERLQRFLDGPAGIQLAKLTDFDGANRMLLAFLARARAGLPEQDAA